MYKAKEKMSYTMRKDEGRPKLQAAGHGVYSGEGRLPYVPEYEVYGAGCELPYVSETEAYGGRCELPYAPETDTYGCGCEDAAAALRSELRSYERAGTHLYLDGHPETADEIARACLLSEDSAYMRDFIGDEHECITEIHFIKIAEDQVFQERKSSR